MGHLTKRKRGDSGNSGLEGVIGFTKEPRYDVCEFLVLNQQKRSMKQKVWGDV